MDADVYEPECDRPEDMAEYVRADLVPQIDVEALEILRHALGIDAYRDRSSWGYRLHFVPGDDAIAACERLVRAGLMVRKDRHPELGGVTYFATQAGRDLFALGRDEG